MPSSPASSSASLARSSPQHNMEANSHGVVCTSKHPPNIILAISNSTIAMKQKLVKRPLCNAKIAVQLLGEAFFVSYEVEVAEIAPQIPHPGHNLMMHIALFGWSIHLCLVCDIFSIHSPIQTVFATGCWIRKTEIQKVSSYWVKNHHIYYMR